MTRPGEYRHRIHIQEPVDTQNLLTGVIVRTWETVSLDSDAPLDAVPAKVMTGPGREMHAAGTKLAETTARLSFRWFPGLKPTWRILWPHDGTFDSDGVFSGRVFDILSIETDLTDRREYRLRVKDGLSDGS